MFSDLCIGQNRGRFVDEITFATYKVVHHRDTNEIQYRLDTVIQFPFSKELTLAINSNLQKRKSMKYSSMELFLSNGSSICRLTCLRGLRLNPYRKSSRSLLDRVLKRYPYFPRTVKRNTQETRTFILNLDEQTILEYDKYRHSTRAKF